MTNQAVIFDLGNVLIDWDMKPSFRPHFDSEEDMGAFLSWFAPLFISHVHDSPHDMGRSLKPAREAHPEHNHLFDVFEHQWFDFMKGPLHDSVALWRDCTQTAPLSLH